MAMSVIRFDLRAPGFTPAQTRDLYATALDMAAWADEHGFDMCVLSEHHGADDGYMTSPVTLAGAVAGRTRRIPINIGALLVPLYDPIRLAEDIAAVDLASGGRLSIVAGLGYRPEEYALFGRDWKTRGKRLDHCLEVMVKAWTGEPFEYEGRTVVVRPRPFSQPHPMVLIGGGGPAAARRAARFGFGLFPMNADETLVDLYHQECERLGRTPGFVAVPRGPGSVFVADDPDRAWAEIGPHLLHDATVYHAWQPDGQRSHVHSDAASVDELRAEGVYQILTPDQCVELAADLGPLGAFIHHPLCGGTPPDLAWSSLQLFADQVLPRLHPA